MRGAHDGTPSIASSRCPSNAIKPQDIQGREPAWPASPDKPNYATNSGKETLMTPSRDWTEIRWADASPAEVSRAAAALPRAAPGQRGPHLPRETDVLIADAYLARVRELLPQSTPATFLPVERIGISTEHIDYPGTQTLPTEVALKKWTAIGENIARHGVKKLVIITS